MQQMLPSGTLTPRLVGFLSHTHDGPRAYVNVEDYLKYMTLYEIWQKGRLLTFVKLTSPLQWSAQPRFSGSVVAAALSGLWWPHPLG